VHRLRALLESHFETDALLWFWGKENHAIRSRAVGKSIDVMPPAETSPMPPDIIVFGTSRLILSRSGSAFLIDAGDPLTLPTLRSLRQEGRFKSLECLWISHYHDDHTDYANEVVAEFGCEVFAIDYILELLSRPAGFRLPCLPPRAVERVTGVRHGAIKAWHEWHFTFEFFPGQTLYHGGLLATRDDGGSYYFVGDSFTPTGIDDYCMQNRNLFGDGIGYEFCLKRIRDLSPEVWLINEHVESLFRFSGAQISRMLAGVRERATIIGEMSCWTDINHMVDESWATVFPYSSTVDNGEDVTLCLRVRNYAKTAATYGVSWKAASGLELRPEASSVVVPPDSTGSVRVSVRPVCRGLHVLACEVSLGDGELFGCAEALVRVP
jgi:glyoxylase-like metal-dependent hydrolase (beta-lactamase superfamily II)